jgi:DNA adenine methylase
VGVSSKRVIHMKPFLKWPGNKYRIIERIKVLLPAGSRLIEPFVGSAAVFLNTDYPTYSLTDANEDLITLYQLLQQEGPDFIRYAKPFFDSRHNRPEAYYDFRVEFNTTEDRRLKAALFLYLNKHGYNGLCRYNLTGGFNVPFGRYKVPYFPEKEMEYFWQKAKNAEFLHADFTDTMANAISGDVVYCDPPYVPLSQTANFTSYSANSFGMSEQLQLATLAQDLAKRGITVLISNHDTPWTQQMYQSAEILPFDVQRNISCNGANRGKAAEMLALFSC